MRLREADRRRDYVSQGAVYAQSAFGRMRPLSLDEIRLGAKGYCCCIHRDSPFASDDIIIMHHSWSKVKVEDRAGARDDAAAIVVYC